MGRGRGLVGGRSYVGDDGADGGTFLWLQKSATNILRSGYPSMYDTMSFVCPPDASMIQYVQHGPLSLLSL